MSTVSEGQKTLYEQLVTRYFRMWVVRDFSELDETFSDDCRYEECYGPIYEGLAQMRS